MSYLYNIIDPKSLVSLSYEDKKIIIQELIMYGNYTLFDKFSIIFDKPIYDILTVDEILVVIPLNMDFLLFEYIIDNYTFENGHNFFYNYAILTDNFDIKTKVYEYFEDNHSDLILDNLKMYNKLIENK